MIKKLFSSVLFLSCLASPAIAQYSVSRVPGSGQTSTENGIFYSLPKNYYRITVEVEETHLQRGIYSDYAEQLLKLPSIKEDQTLYQIRKIDIHTLALPDPEQTFFVKGPQIPSLNLNSQGILKTVNGNLEKAPGEHKQGIPEPDGQPGRHPAKGKRTQGNIPPSTPVPHQGERLDTRAPYTPVASLNVNQRFDTVVHRYQTDTLLIVEKILKPRIDEKSLSEQARKVASQILKIQADQADLLSGLQEVAYPASTMEFMYRQMGKNVRQYLDCFTGTMRTEIRSYEFYVRPIGKETQYAVAFFSPESGLEKTDSPSMNHFDSDTDLLVFEIEPEHEQNIDSLGKTISANTENPDGFFYRIPLQAQARIRLNGEELCIKNIPVAQWGKVFSLPIRKEYILKLNTKTGAIRYFGLPDGVLPGNIGKRK